MQKRMFLILSSLLLTFMGSVGCTTKNQHSEAPAHPADEMKIKQAIMNQDVRRTKELMQMQYLSSFGQLLGNTDQTSADKLRMKLEQYRKTHAKTEFLACFSAQQPVVTSGRLSKKVKSFYQKQLPLAKKQARLHHMYMSAPFHEGKREHVLIAVHQDHSLLVGMADGSLPSSIRIHQTKNLRIVPYPSDKRFDIESVDPHTLKKKHVQHPEENEGISHYHEHQVVVKFKKHPSAAELKRMKQETGSIEVKRLDHIYIFKSEKLSYHQLADYFHQRDVMYIEPHYLYSTNSAVSAASNPAAQLPNDTFYSEYQWNLPDVDTIKGWQLSKGSKQAVVAVVDTGADLTHPDLQKHLVSGHNFIDESRPPADDVGHGTHVSGIISAIVDNDMGVAGMTWYNPIMPVKVLDHTGAGSTYSVAEGIIWAADHGAKVINLSLGNYAQAHFLHDAIKYAFKKDVVIIAASGNDNTSKKGYPAAYPEVFAVGATNLDKKRAVFSNYGNYIDVVAPGVNIASTYYHHQYAALSGTSMASPHVTALAALIRSVNPGLSNTEVMDIMRKTAQDLGAPGKDKYYGYGQIDVAAALKAADPHQDHKTNTTSWSWQQWISRKLKQIFG